MALHVVSLPMVPLLHHQGELFFKNYHHYDVVYRILVDNKIILQQNVVDFSIY